MKYDAEIRPDEDNTSHVIVLDLVGAGKAVLDVGCSTGYLAVALGERGCTVTGIEVDPEAAELARPHLKDVVVADLDTVNLDSLGIEDRFDVVVFADVLEHLRDPVGTLRAASDLLRPDGYVVVSIPNVAHGSVRLALLEGRFDYSDVGLLDETHIRFFTRSTLRAFTQAAGFAVQDMRRTTAPVFGTEIRIDPGGVPTDVLADLEGDADAETYQFVFSAIPTHGRRDEVATILDDRERELALLRRQLAEIVRRADLGPRSPVVALVAWGAETVARLRADVVEGQLRRRLDGFVIRRFSADEVERLVRSAGPLSELGRIDAAVLTGVAGVARRVLAERLEQAGVKSVLFGVDVTDGDGLDGWSGSVVGSPAADTDAQWSVVPDPAVAAASLFDPELLAQRVEYLRLLAAIPVEGPYALASFRQVARGQGGSLLRNLQQVASAQGLGLVLADAPEHAGEWIISGTEPLDLVAAASGALVIISDDAGLLATALSLGRAAIGVDTGDDRLADLANWLGDADLLVPRLAAVSATLPIAEARAADPRVRSDLDRTLSTAFDRLSADLAESAADQTARSLPARLLELQDEVNLLRSTNAGLVVRQRAERVAFGRRAATLLATEQSDGGSRTWSELRRLSQANGQLERALVDARALEGENQRLQAEAEQARAELTALLATRTFRTLGPARGLYRRLRSVLR